MNSATTTHQYHGSEVRPWGFNRLARYLVFRMLSKLEQGQIILQDAADCLTFGRESELKVHVTVHSNSIYGKILLGGSIGAGETYVDGLWEVDDLTRLVRIMVLNMKLVDRIEEGLAWILRPFSLLLHGFNRNNKKGAKKNILAHYDLGNEMYQSFLDSTMMYSSAIYPAKESTLEEASIHKLETICRKLDLQSTDRVIEIGSGWGGFAIYAASTYGCHITTTTISDAQYNEAKKRITKAKLTDKITLLRQDYRDLTGQYDKLVSIEMIEAVGDPYLPDFFQKCQELLKEDGAMLLQAITITDQKHKQYIRSVDFIQRYIFPGGCLPSNNRMVQLIAAKTDMVVRSLDDFGFDYARTLADWLERFNKSFITLKKIGYDDTFKRLWEFYLAYCEGGFRERSISVVHLVATRPGNRSPMNR